MRCRGGWISEQFMEMEIFARNNFRQWNETLHGMRWDEFVQSPVKVRLVVF